MKTLKFFLTTLLCFVALASYAEEKEKADSTESKKSDYEKLFSAKHEIAEGMIKLHLVKGKVYFEMPVDLMDREMLIGSTITEISDNGMAIVGSKPTSPRHVKFTKNDTKVQLREITNDYITDDPNSSIAAAIEKSSIGGIIRNMKIEAWSPDSSAVVFDMTSFFVSDDKKMLPFDSANYYARAGYETTQTFKSNESYINKVKAFSDNVSVSSTLSYEYTVQNRNGQYAVQKNPFTAVVTRSVILLDEEPYRSRIGDSRMSVFPTGKYMLESKGSGIKTHWYSNRWRLEPSDEEAYARGELVEPKKQIVFYIDSNFPENWKPAVREGVNQWNEMFETIGFKNAIAAKDFPADDPEFDPDNLKYTCIRYAPVSIENAMGPSWVDPRSGEILTASVYIYHDVANLIRNWRFVQTAPSDKSVRHKELPLDVFQDALRYVVAHEVGHCLGYMHQFSASYQIPVDSLRSPSYTQKHGTTTSIMDYARFNYVAQPGDVEKGVKVTPPRFGVYDQYAVKWLYTAFPGTTQEEETAILMKWLQEASKDPMYMYGKQLGSIIDPRSQYEDLGNDAIKASEYGIKNLKYLIENYNAWVADEDEDMEFRTEILNEAVNQYVRYINHIYNNLGGLYLKDVKAGDEGEPFSIIPEDYQRKALKFICDQIGNLDWFDNKEIMAILPITGSVTQVVEKALVPAIVEAPVKVMRFGSIGEENYSYQECLEDVFDFVWKSAKSRKELSQTEMYLQEYFVKFSAVNAGLASQGEANALAINPEKGISVAVPEGFTARENLMRGSDYHAEGGFNPVAGYSDYRLIYTNVPSNIQSSLYGKLIEARKIVKKAASSTKGTTKAHYQYLAEYIDNVLESK